MTIEQVLTTDTPNAGRAKLNANDQALAAAIAAIPIEPDQAATVYVSKAGSDANDGLTLARPKLTLTAAIEAAVDLITGGQPNALVAVVDAGRYTENLTIPNGLHVHAPAATLVGTADLGNDCSLTVHRHLASANGQAMVEKAGGSGHAFYRANVMDTRGLAGSFTGGQALRNASNGSVLFAFVGVLFVAANAVGVGDGAPNFGHTHFWTPDLYLAGDNAIGIRAQANSNFIGYIGRVLETGSPTGTTAIVVQHASAVVKVTATEIVADTAYQVTAGQLHLTCPKLTGARSGTPACELTNIALIGAWGVLDASNPA